MPNTLTLLAESDIPPHLHAGIVRYIDSGVQPGGFLTAVINGNLFDAYALADQSSKAAIPTIVEWFRQHAPTNSYASPNSVHFWVDLHRAKQKPVQGAANQKVRPT